MNSITYNGATYRLFNTGMLGSLSDTLMLRLSNAGPLQLYLSGSDGAKYVLFLSESTPFTIQIDDDERMPPEYDDLMSGPETYRIEHLMTSGGADLLLDRGAGLE